MRIFIAGTFDNFHVGHQHFCWQALSQASELFIIIGRDETVKKIKGAYPSNDEKKRLNRVKKEFKNFERVFVEWGRSDGDFSKTIKKFNPEIIILGYDQHLNQTWIEKEFPNIKITRGKAYFPAIFKSSYFKREV